MRPLMLVVVLLSLLLALEASAVLTPQVIETKFPTDDVVIASLVVQPPADRYDNASPMLQEAIDRVAAEGGGVIFLPAGTYHIATPLVVKERVILRGDWAPPGKARPGETTMLAITANRGEADGPPALATDFGSGVRELTIWYPEQDATTIEPYPWTFATQPGSSVDNTSIYNVTLVNAYQGIKSGPHGNELHTLRNIYGTPLKCGIWVDTCTDIGRQIHVDFAPHYWVESGLPGAPESPSAIASLEDWLLHEAIGVDIGRSDWEYIYDVHVTGYQQGFKFRSGQAGTTNAVMFGCETKGCDIGIQLDALNGIGLSVTASKLDGLTAAVRGMPSFDTTAQFHTTEFSSPSGACALLEGRGFLSFQHCTFSAWEEAGINAPSGQINALDCDFSQRGLAINLGADVTRARILSNRFTGEPVVANSSDGDIEIAHTPIEFEVPSPKLQPVIPDPRPATSKLFVVTDYGALSGGADCTAAFQRALDEAGAAGGGTVYVPPGYWYFDGVITVPTGVELRGMFDVPHHTSSAGSVLMVKAGKGEENGTPFVRLGSKSGLRGLTFWYPEQDLTNLSPYPWTIQSTGPGCWLLDVTCGNSYQGADFWTYDSTGHLIRYFAGCYLRRGLFISKSEGPGYTEDVMYNPHFSARLPAGLPRGWKGDAWGPTLDFIWRNQEGIVFGRCDEEWVARTFLYASYAGMKFADDNGGMSGQVINHGTDAGSVGVLFEATSEEGVDLYNSQLVHFGPVERCAIETAPGFTGKARLFNSQLWAGPTSGIIAGPGKLVLQQMNTLTGPFYVEGGDFTLENCHFTRELTPHIAIGEKVKSARLLANVSVGKLNVENNAGDRLLQLGGSAVTAPNLGTGGAPYTFASGFEAGEPQPFIDTVQMEGGGLRAVDNPVCQLVPGAGREGGTALRVAGTPTDPSYSFVYLRVFATPLAIASDTKLTYWIKPEDEEGRKIAVDLLFSDGSYMRDLGLGLRPGGDAGAPGEWHQVSVALGRLTGKTIAVIMFAYDSRSANGPFSALIDDVSLTSDAATSPWRVETDPAEGPLEVGMPLRLASAAPGIRYTLDGSNPTGDSPLYTGPIVPTKPGLLEVRFAATREDGAPGSLVFSRLFDVLPQGGAE